MGMEQTKSTYRYAEKLLQTSLDPDAAELPLYRHLCGGHGPVHRAGDDTVHHLLRQAGARLSRIQPRPHAGGETCQALSEGPARELEHQRRCGLLRGGPDADGPSPRGAGGGQCGRFYGQRPGVCREREALQGRALLCQRRFLEGVFLPLHRRAALHAGGCGGEGTSGRSERVAVQAAVCHGRGGDRPSLHVQRARLPRVRRRAGCVQRHARDGRRAVAAVTQPDIHPQGAGQHGPAGQCVRLSAGGR